jgi:hypothetical protein
MRFANSIAFLAAGMALAASCTDTPVAPLRDDEETDSGGSPADSGGAATESGGSAGIGGASGGAGG